ncbi:MAG TPA: hypothetical protein EYP61_04590 [Candidatus Latescibacteria bacterium]|nr:hypothetical protein [Candidatus Latescibacterota bacterium]
MRCIVAFTIVAAVLVSCGGGAGPKAKAEGAVYVQNRDENLDLKVKVEFINGRPPGPEHLPEGTVPGQEVTVPPGEGPVQVTAVLPGGTEVQLSFWLRKRRNRSLDVTVTVDGSQMVDFGPNTNIEAGFVDYQVKPY